MAGKFIVVSGGEGTGKSTVLGRLAEMMPEVLFTKEPGGTALGREIRRILLDRPDLAQTGLAEFFLFFADRAQHLAEVVEPTLARGQHIISDRYWMDTYAYEWVAEMNRHDVSEFMRFIEMFKFRKPDLWLLFDLDPRVGIARRKTTKKMDRMDSREVAFHDAVRGGFLELAKADLGFPLTIIDASQPLEHVIEQAQKACKTSGV